MRESCDGDSAGETKASESSLTGRGVARAMWEGVRKGEGVRVETWGVGSLERERN